MTLIDIAGEDVDPPQPRLGLRGEVILAMCLLPTARLPSLLEWAVTLVVSQRPDS